MRRTLIAGAIAHVANAWWIDPAPSATNGPAMKELGDAIGWTPRPTEPATHRDLIRRQAATQILGYLAPDNTCGYVAGRVGGVKTCEAGSNCAAVLGTDDFYTMGCCGSGLCAMQGVCYDYATITDCDQACQQDANIVKCSNTQYPYCYPYSVPGMNMGFFSCDSVTTTSFQVFETTFSGQTGADTWLALRQTDIDSILDTSTTSRTRTGGDQLDPSSRTSGASGSTTSSLRPFPTTAVPDPDDEDKGSSTPVGAIVGGVVGGLAVLGLVAGGIVFFLFKKRKAKQAAAAAGGAPPPAGPHMSQQYTPGPPPGNPNSGYFAPAPVGGGKYDGSAAKYDGAGGPSVTESNIPGSTPMSPAPAYSLPVPGQGQQFAGGPSPSQSPPPPQDPPYSYVPPPQAGYHEAPGSTYQPAPGPQQAYPPQQGGAPAPGPAQGGPVELGNNYAVPNQYQGRPVYEAA